MGLFFRWEHIAADAPEMGVFGGSGAIGTRLHTKWDFVGDTWPKWDFVEDTWRTCTSLGTISPSEVAVSQQGGGWQRCLSLQLSRRCCSPSPCRRRRQARWPPFLPLAPLANCPSFLPKLAACSPAVRCLSLAPTDEKFSAPVPARKPGSQLLTEPDCLALFAGDARTTSWPSSFRGPCALGERALQPRTLGAHLPRLALPTSRGRCFALMGARALR